MHYQMHDLCQACAVPYALLHARKYCNFMTQWHETQDHEALQMKLVTCEKRQGHSMYNTHNI